MFRRQHRPERTEEKEVIELGKDAYISFLDGNRHDPVLVVGEDDSTATEDNEATHLLVVKLGRAESVAKDSVKEEETSSDSEDRY